MSTNVQSIGFVFTKWILTVVFMTCTVLVLVTGVVNIIYGIQLIKEVSQYDLTNGAMLVVWGVCACLYGCSMYFVIQKSTPEFWIEGFLLASIAILTLYLIFGSAGVAVGSKSINYNIIHYLQMMYRTDDEYSIKTLDRVHQFYECCGLFSNQTFILSKNGSVNWSCCRNGRKGATCRIEHSYILGCEEPVTRSHNGSFYNLGSMWMSIGTIYLVMVFLAFYFQKMYTHRPN